jgi:hypothetical protein
MSFITRAAGTVIGATSGVSPWLMGALFGAGLLVGGGVVGVPMYYMLDGAQKAEAAETERAGHLADLNLKQEKAIATRDLDIAHLNDQLNRLIVDYLDSQDAVATAEKEIESRDVVYRAKIARLPSHTVTRLAYVPLDGELTKCPLKKPDIAQVEDAVVAAGQNLPLILGIVMTMAYGYDAAFEGCETNFAKIRELQKKAVQP